MAKINENIEIGNTGCSLKKLIPYLLWTNPNPNNSFGSQSIQLNLNEYKIIEIWFKHYRTDDTRLCMKTLVPSKEALNYVEMDTYYNQINMQKREFEVKTNEIVFQEGLWYFAGRTAQTDNSRCVPLYVIGYKTNLFS